MVDQNSGKHYCYHFVNCNSIIPETWCAKIYESTVFGGWEKELPETNFASLSGTAGDNQASSIKVREGCTFKGFDEDDQNKLIFERTDDIQLEFQYENLNQNGMNANDKLTSYSCKCQGRLLLVFYFDVF